MILLAHLRNIFNNKKTSVGSYLDVHEPWLIGFQANFAENTGGPVLDRFTDFHEIGRRQTLARGRGQTLTRGRGQTVVRGRGKTLARGRGLTLTRGRGQP